MKIFMTVPAFQAYALEFLKRDGDHSILSTPAGTGEYWTKVSDFEKENYIVKSVE